MVKMILLVLLLASSYLVNCDYTNCSTDLKVLENALYEYDYENYLTLSKAFYPPGKEPSRLLKVNYIFGEDCNVTYYRSIGGFLFIQPPHIFELTSLYFNFPAKSSSEVPKIITLKMPMDCAGLVNKYTSDMCSCHHHDNKEDSYSMLDTLTQQVGILYFTETYHTHSPYCTGRLHEDIYI